MAPEYGRESKIAAMIKTNKTKKILQNRFVFLTEILYEALMGPSPSAFSRSAVDSYWRKYVHEVLVNRLGGLSLPRKSVVRLTDRPDMTLDVYRGRKTTIQLMGPGCSNLSK